VARTVRLYLDEHVPSAVAHGLRLHGADVLTTGDAGMLAASDEAHPALATAQGRTIVTQDDDFLKLHPAGASHSGIIYAVQALSSRNSSTSCPTVSAPSRWIPVRIYARSR